MRILVTRPEPDASAQAAELRQRGHEVVVSPLSVVDVLPCDLETVAGDRTVAGLVVTSRNALRAIAANGIPADVRSKPVFCVGQDTAAMAREAGFLSVTTGPGTATALIPIIAKAVRPDSGQLLRLTGDMPSHAPKRTSAALRSSGYDVTDVICYRTHAGSELTTQAADALRLERVDAVILMSPFAAKTYLGALKGAGLTLRSESPKYVCLSQAVADVLVGFPNQDIFIADKPNHSGLLSIIDHVVAKLS